MLQFPMCLIEDRYLTHLRSKVPVMSRIQVRNHGICVYRAFRNRTITSIDDRLGEGLQVLIGWIYIPVREKKPSQLHSWWPGQMTFKVAWEYEYLLSEEYRIQAVTVTLPLSEIQPTVNQSNEIFFTRKLDTVLRSLVDLNVQKLQYSGT